MVPPPRYVYVLVALLRLAFTGDVWTYVRENGLQSILESKLDTGMLWRFEVKTHAHARHTVLFVRAPGDY